MPLLLCSFPGLALATLPLDSVPSGSRPVGVGRLLEPERRREAVTRDQREEVAQLFYCEMVLLRVYW